jgi:hypothetical protein
MYVGQRVSADISGLTPILGSGSVTPGTITEQGAPGTWIGQIDSSFNGVNVFQLTEDRLTPLG